MSSLWLTLSNVKVDHICLASVIQLSADLIHTFNVGSTRLPSKETMLASVQVHFY